MAYGNGIGPPRRALGHLRDVGREGGILRLIKRQNLLASGQPDFHIGAVVGSADRFDTIATLAVGEANNPCPGGLVAAVPEIEAGAQPDVDRLLGNGQPESRCASFQRR